MNLEEKAKKLATKLHNGQFRKDGKTPYIKHPEAVVNLLKSIGITDSDILCAAWLHDVIEDCHVSKDEIAQEFNLNIARIVATLTRNVEREAYKERIKNADYAVQIIKLADVVHNCSELNIPNLPKKTIRRKIEDSEELYLSLARKVCPKFYNFLKEYLKPFQSN